MRSAEPSPSDDEPRLSFKEREVLAALRRLAKAQSQVAALEEQAEAGGAVLDPADVALVAEQQAQIDKLRPKAQSRFGGASAREKLAALEADQRLVLDRLGATSVAEVQVLQRQAAATAAATDPAVLDFARRELASAEEAYREALAMPDDPPPDDEEADGSDAIDLTRPEAS